MRQDSRGAAAAQQMGDDHLVVRGRLTGGRRDRGRVPLPVPGGESPGARFGVNVFIMAGGAEVGEGAGRDLDRAGGSGDCIDAVAFAAVHAIVIIAAVVRRRAGARLRANQVVSILLGVHLQQLGPQATLHLHVVNGRHARAVTLESVGGALDIAGLKVLLHDPAIHRRQMLRLVLGLGDVWRAVSVRLEPFDARPVRGLAMDYLRAGGNLVSIIVMLDALVNRGLRARGAHRGRGILTLGDAVGQGTLLLAHQFFLGLVVVGDRGVVGEPLPVLRLARGHGGEIRRPGIDCGLPLQTVVAAVGLPGGCPQVNEAEVVDRLLVRDGGRLRGNLVLLRHHAVADPAHVSGGSVNPLAELFRTFARGLQAPDLEARDILLRRYLGALVLDGGQVSKRGNGGHQIIAPACGLLEKGVDKPNEDEPFV